MREEAVGSRFLPFFSFYRNVRRAHVLDAKWDRARGARYAILNL
jgi:hypothetical protein